MCLHQKKPCLKCHPLYRVLLWRFLTLVYIHICVCIFIYVYRAWTAEEGNFGPGLHSVYTFFAVNLSTSRIGILSLVLKSRCPGILGPGRVPRIDRSTPGAGSTSDHSSALLHPLRRHHGSRGVELRPLSAERAPSERRRLNR